MIYYLMIIGCLATAPLINRKFKISRRSNLDGTMFYVILWGIILISVCGLRRVDIGRDTAMYQLIYRQIQSSEIWNARTLMYSSHEYGFYFLMYLVSRLFDYQVFLYLGAIISIAPVMYVIYKYSDNKPMSLVLYMCFSFYTFCFSGQRQAMALGVLMIAYCFLREKKLKYYILFVILAVLFHTSAILFLPIYWIDKIQYNKKTVSIFLLLMVGSYLLRNQLWSVATLFARQQYTANDAGGLLMYLFMILTVVLGLIYRKYFTGKRNENKVYLYLQVLAACLWPIASVNSALSRMYMYYQVFLILYVPALLKSIGNRHQFERLIVKYGYYAVALYFLVDEVMAPVKQFYPYYFFWQ